MARDRIRSKDLSQPDSCGHCGHPIEVHLTPMGDPAYMVRTGWCERCQSSRFGLDGVDCDVRHAARQLIAQLEGIASL